MTKILKILALLLGVAGFAHASDNIVGDLFPYEFKHSSFTVDIEASKLDRFSVQVIYSTEAIPAVQLTGASIDTTNDTLTVSTNSIGAGQPVLLSTQGAAAPSPLATGTTYYAVRITDTLLKLATTYAQAVSRDTIDLLTAPAGTWTLVPVPLNTGSAGFSWSASNDGVNWIGAASVGSTVNGSTHSLTSMGTASLGSRLFDWGEFAYRFLRFTFNGPSYGAIKLRAFINAKTRS